MSPTPLLIVGRDAELERIWSALAGAAQAPAAVMIEGPAGIGKTTVLEATATRARNEGWVVLQARPSASSRQLAFFGLSDLVHDLTRRGDGFLDELPELQREALAVATRTARSDSPLDPLTVMVAWRTVCERFLAREPLLLCFDDLQWLDDATADCLLYLLRRVPEGRFAVLLATRTAEADRVIIDARRALPPDQWHDLSLGPLAERPSRSLVTSRIGHAVPAARFGELHRVAAGNPLLLLEYARSLEQSGRIDPAATITEPLRARLAEATEPARRALLATALAAKPTIALLDAVLADIGLDLRTILPELEDLGLARLSSGRLRFDHPLVGAAALASVTSAQQRSMHRILADTTDDSEERARHLGLAATGEDPDAAHALFEASQLAWQRGAPTAGCELAELALELAAPADQARLLFELGRLRHRAGLLDDAVDALEQCLEFPPGPVTNAPDRREILLELFAVRLRIGDAGATRALIEPLAASIPADGSDPVDAAAAALLTGSFYLRQGQLADGAVASRAAVSAAEASEDPALQAEALGFSVLAGFLNGHGFHDDDVERTLRDERPLTRRVAQLHPAVNATLVWLWAGRLADADRACGLALQRYGPREPSLEPMNLGLIGANVACQRGQLDRADTWVAYARDLADRHESPMMRCFGDLAGAWVEAYRGSGSQAAAAVSAALKALDPSLMTVTYPVAFGALTFGLLGEGLHEPLAEAAIGPFSILRTVAMEPGVVPFAIDYAEALIALDRIDEAADVLDWFEHSARRQRRSWALALAQRTRALYFLRLGELPIARVEAEAATAALAGSDHVIDAARAALVAGTVAAAGRDATSANNHLTQASRAFSGHGIMAWAARADAMLRQLADTRRQSASLTATELRVAELAADGLMNREIAIRLHMSPKTVEVHLTRAFAKLGVRRRVELAARLAQH